MRKIVVSIVLSILLTVSMAFAATWHTFEGFGWWEDDEAEGNYFVNEDGDYFVNEDGDYFVWGE